MNKTLYATPAVSANQTPESAYYGWYILALLTLIYSFNWIDRYVLVILLEPIKQELALSDASLGFISGFGFAIVYSLAGIPVARLADRGVRRNLIAIAVGVWSGMTLLCGLAQNFAQLLLARLGVALGESGCSPAAHSLIADYFPGGRRATAFSIYGLGVIAGLSLGLFIGGWANQAFGWRWALVIAALPGPVLALLMRFTVREPRRVTDFSSHSPVETDSVPALARRLCAGFVFPVYAVGVGLMCLAGSAYDTWTPAFLIRVHHMDSGQVGQLSGTLLAVSGLLGTLGSGILADWLGRRDKRWYLWLPAASGALMAVFVVLFLNTPKSVAMIVYYFIASLFASALLAPIIAITQTLMPASMRAVSSAVLFLLINLIGTGAGAYTAGLVSDALTARYGDESIRYAVSITQAAAVVGAFLIVWAARRLPDRYPHLFNK